MVSSVAHFTRSVVITCGWLVVSVPFYFLFYPLGHMYVLPQIVWGSLVIASAKVVHIYMRVNGKIVAPVLLRTLFHSRVLCDKVGVVSIVARISQE